MPKARATLLPQSEVEKIIINIVDSDHDMWDIVDRVIGSWDAKSDDEPGAIPVVWNLVPSLVEGLTHR